MNCLINYPDFQWSLVYLIEQLFLCLIKAKEKDGITRKYEKRARWFLRRVNLSKPQSKFIIYRKDLTREVYGELVKLQKASPQTLNYVITRALEMIFECIEEADESIFNGNYYLLSVKRYNPLKWRFDRNADQELDPHSKYDINYSLYDTKGIVIGRILDNQQKGVRINVYS